MISERSTLELRALVGSNCGTYVKFFLFLIICVTVKYYSLVSFGLLIGLSCATQPDHEEELLRALLGGLAVVR